MASIITLVQQTPSKAHMHIRVKKYQNESFTIDVTQKSPLLRGLAIPSYVAQFPNKYI